MRTYHTEIPSRFLEPRIHPTTPEQIMPFIEVLPGSVSYNGVNDVFQNRKYLPAVRNQGAYVGTPPYPHFSQDRGDIFLVRARIIGEDKKLPRISVGTLATADAKTFVNIPLGLSYPNSRYEERAVVSSNDRTEDIAKAIFGVINNLPAEEEGSFFDAYVADKINLHRLQKSFSATRKLRYFGTQPE